jgi:hypothetical protein
MYVAPPELWILGAATSYKHRAPTELKTCSDDNPPKLMYKGKAEQISNLLIAYA